MGHDNSSFLIITGSSPESHSPSGERLRHLAIASSSRFDQVAVLALRKTPRDNKREREESRVSVFTINFTRGVPYPLSVLLDPVKVLMFLMHGLVLCRRIRPSHILASMPPLETGVSAWILTKLAGIPLFVDLRDDWEAAASFQLKRYFPEVSAKILLAIAKEIYSSASAILAVTETIAETTRRRNVGTSVLLVPNGADSELFAQADAKTRRRIRQECGLPLDKIVVAYCGSGVNPYYRLDMTLSSVKALPKEVAERVFFVFYVYNGIENLKRLQSQLGIPENRLEIRRPLPRSQLAEVLAACDVGLVPFDAKPYLLCARSTKIYEYLSSGLYVICSGPKGGELDVLLSANDALGMFVSPSVENFVKAFRLVSENTEDFLSEDLKSLRHSFIRENYDRQNMMRKAVDMLFSRVSSSLTTQKK